jgi:hypothetical protein
MNENAHVAYSFFKQRGYSDAAAAGIVGHIEQESGFDPTKVHDGGTGYGIVGWRDPEPGKGRRTDFFNWADANGKARNGFTSQLEYLDYELRNKETGVFNRLGTAATPTDAARVFMDFERPQGWTADNPTAGHGWANRNANAARAYNLFSGKAPAYVDTPVAAETVTSAVQRTPTVGDADVSPKTPITDVEQHRYEAAQRDKAMGFGEGIWEGAKDASPITWAFQGSNAAPDPNFDWQKQRQLLTDLSKDIPKEYWGRLENAHSEAHARQIVDRIKEERALDERFAAAGWSGVASRMIGEIAEPSSLAAAFFVPEVGLPAKIGRLGRLAVRGAEAGAMNTAAELPRFLGKETSSGSDLLWAAGSGIAMGAAFGSLARNPAVAPERARWEAVGKSLMREGEATANGLPAPPMGSTAGAMHTSIREDLHPDILPWHSKELAESDAPVTALGKYRFDVVGRLKNSESPVVRALGNLLGQDAVGNADKSVATSFAASEYQKKVHGGMMDRAVSEYRPALKQWFDDHEVGWTGRADAEREFRGQITEFIRNEDPSRDFHPAVAKMGEKLRTLHADYVDLLTDPGRVSGRSLKPVPGFENLEYHANYIMRQIDHSKVAEHTVRFGDQQISEALALGIKGAQPDIEMELARKIGTGYLKRIRNLGAGIDTKGDLAVSGANREAMREVLADMSGISAEEIEKVMAAFTRPAGEGVSARAKRRTLFDENFSTVLRDTRTGEGVQFRLADLFENDAMQLFEAYSRHVSGLVGMQQVHVKNPRFGITPEEPEFLVEGLARQSDWDRAIERVKQSWDSLDPKARNKAEADVKNLQFLRDGIMGHGDPFDQTSAGKFLRMVRDYNFVRLMNQVGLAQVAEAGMVVASMGVKASLEGIPALRTLWRNAKTGELDNALAREIEWVTGYGTDWLRGSLRHNLDDLGNPMNFTGHSARLKGLDDALQTGKRVTNAISGMAPINTFLQRWAGKAVFAKFANMAGGEKANIARLAYMGVDEAMAQRIFGQIKKHGSFVDGEVSGRKLRRMNVEKWDDAAAQSSFEMATHRWVRYAILENDVGGMNRVLGSGWGKLIGQFRAFVFGAWAKHTLHNIHMRDPQAFGAMLATTAFGALSYVAQTHLNAVGRSDRDKYLEKRLSLQGMAAGAFQRSSMSSVIPMAVDTGLRPLGFQPVFDARTTGQASDALFGNPSVGLFNDALKGIGGVAGMAHGNPYSQADARSLGRVLPFGNFAPWTMTLNTMIRGLPEHDPKQR